MPLTQQAQGTQAATGAEDTVFTYSANGVVTWVVNLSNMAAGDTTVLRLYRKIISSGALVLAYEQSFTGAQTADAQVSVPLPSPFQCRGTLQQSAGTLRNYEYSVETY